MIRILMRRISFMVFTMFVVSMAVFAISEIVPVDVARNILGQFATEDTIQTYRESRGLNCPATTRYAIWLMGDDWIQPMRGIIGESILPLGCTPPKLQRRGLLRGDMGISSRSTAPVGPMLQRRLKNSLTLAGVAFAIIIPLSLFLGSIAGLKFGKIPDRIISLGSLITASIPEFASGVVLIVIFANWLKLLPPLSIFVNENSILESPSKLIMPVMVLVLIETGYVTRMTRASVVEVTKSAYVRAAMLRGIPYWSWVFKHVLRNALLAPITVILLHANWMIGGIVIIEATFGYPGLGNMMLDATLNKDINTLEACTIVLVFVSVATQFIGDLFYVYLNPKIRFS
jgi:peptide/nickel transport system permease protein